MKIVVAVSRASDWPLRLPGVEVLQAQRYLADPEWNQAGRVRVFNLCRSYRYQSTGYYVSLLAAARGHMPVPSLGTILDLRSRGRVRTVDDELDALIRRSLAPLRSDAFTLSVYFGANLASRYARLALELFNQFPAPLLRAHFVRESRWRLRSLTLVPAREIPEAHLPFVQEQAQRYFARPRLRTRRRRTNRYDMAILHDPDEDPPPSRLATLRRIVRVAARLDVAAELVRKDDLSRLAEFDALFIRQTTSVNHYTFRFASRAEQEGLVVIDDPQSIVRCSNKVYLAEAMRLHKVPIPRTVIASRANVEEIESAVGLPCVLKHPDSAFSQGVVRCETRAELEQQAHAILEESELFVAQEYMPTSFDWRIGVLGKKPLFACRYHMAKGHWQIIEKTRTGRFRYGDSDCVPVEKAPPRVVRTAVRAANLMGDGLYGVDVKEAGRRCVVMEVNDNPNIDLGCEDLVLGDELYRRIVTGFIDRIEARGRR